MSDVANPAQESRARILTAYLLLTLTALFWAGNTIVGRAVIDELPPLGFSFWRSFSAFLFIAPFGLPRIWRARQAVIADWKRLVMLGFLGMTAFSVLVFSALHHTTAINGSLIQGSFSVTVVITSWLVLHVAISRHQAIGVAIGLAGLVVIVARGDFAVLTGLTFYVGDPVLWLGVFCHALFSTLVTRRSMDVDVIAFLTVAFFVGSVTSLPLHLWEIADGRAMPLSLTALWAIIYVGLFPSLLAQLFWVMGIERIGPAVASNFIYLTPVFGTLMAVAFLGEIFAWYHAAGIALIFISIYLATAGRK